jgi:hypothetical protein
MVGVSYFKFNRSRETLVGVRITPGVDIRVNIHDYHDAK